MRNLLSKWYDKFRLLKDMSLKSLVIDVTHCCCEQACCRLVRDLCKEILERHMLPKGLRSNPYRLFLIRLADVDVRFTGLADDDERAFIRRMGLSS